MLEKQFGDFVCHGILPTCTTNHRLTTPLASATATPNLEEAAVVHECRTLTSRADTCSTLSQIATTTRGLDVVLKLLKHTNLSLLLVDALVNLLTLVLLLTAWLNEVVERIQHSVVLAKVIEV